MPRFVAQTCLILGNTLSDYELSYCMLIPGRGYGTFDRFVNGALLCFSYDL